MFGRKRNKEPKESKLQDKVAGKIADAWVRVQTKLSERVNKLFSKMSVKKLKVMLVVFCLGCGGYSIYLMVNAIVSPDKQPSFKVDQVDVPKHFDETGDEIIQPESYVDEGTFQKIQGFKEYIDSLRTNKSKLYDSIVIARPGLIDSILVLKEIYNSQKIK